MSPRNPEVAILMGSQSDWKVMKRAEIVLGELGISSEAKIRPRLAGIDKNKDNSIDLFWIFETKINFPFFIALDKTGRETVPIAIPAIARLIW